VTHGGIPEGRTTLVCGAAGCGKTLFGMQFLIRGAVDHEEPGVFVAFEESEGDLAKNVASLGFDVHDLQRRGLLAVDHIRVERNEIEENGEYDLEGLFIRLGLALDTVKGKRLVILAVPTLIRKIPEPMKRVIGDLSNADRALVALDMQAAIAGEGA
jgi:circadian clock protein KaiC